MMRGVFYRESVVVFFYAAASIVEEAIYLFFFPLFSLSFFLILFLASEAEGVKERSQKHYKLRNFRGDLWAREKEREREEWFSSVWSMLVFGVDINRARGENLWCRADGSPCN